MRMRRTVLLILGIGLGLGLGSPAKVTAQSASESETQVVATVERFFFAMAERDPALARSVLTEDGHYYALRGTGADVTPELHTFADFVRGLEGPGRIVIERMWDPEVDVRGGIATVWTPYDLYVDGTFSHCGIDAFSLVKAEGDWKIAGIVFTAEPEGCPRHPDGPPL